ncbi:hypothetical protein [Actinomadura roseirufa]|uniref:hypothetical protein n=1 Tax=Actinomadura roseirufa TaxID=2094049 RepID=UPI001040FB28|nr:hypothetical protein [Actinomadura roseirufa]
MAKRNDPAERGPGASSGQEEQPRERIVPGMGSAAEGYDAEDAGGGTKTGDPLAGVRKDPDES